ncbi:PEP-CTERM sorting domain-containing protein [bacterium]|nr:PEP-CTERM sorting domain-containing protein [bacterium]
MEYDEDSGGDDIAIADFRFAQIPEPTTIVLMGFGVLGLLGIAIRQRRKRK